MTEEDTTIDDDVRTILDVLRAGPAPYGLPLVADARQRSAHEVGGPLWAALAACVSAGIVRILPIDEVDERRLCHTGWPLCEDIR